MGCSCLKVPAASLIAPLLHIMIDHRIQNHKLGMVTLKTCDALIDLDVCKVRSKSAQCGVLDSVMAFCAI